MLQALLLQALLVMHPGLVELASIAIAGKASHASSPSRACCRHLLLQALLGMDTCIAEHAGVMHPVLAALPPSITPHSPNHR